MSSPELEPISQPEAELPELSKRFIIGTAALLVYVSVEIGASALSSFEKLIEG